jgi:RND family efflux transporter MFP subunit
MNWQKTVLISLGILITGGVLVVLIFTTQPTASKSGATKQTAMLVEVTGVEKGNFKPLIRTMGTVRPSQDIMLSPRVSGEITERDESFVPGGYVEKGDRLLQIDPADYRTAYQQRQSELRQAKADLNLELGLQQAAEKEYQLLDDTLAPMNKSLVLREPQLDAARAAVESAEAALQQAKLDLRRTTIRGPFDAYIIDRMANVGSQVAVGEQIGRLVGMETYWIEATLPVSKLRWLQFPQTEKERGTAVKIRNRTAWPPDIYRTGYLYKRLGTLENQTRMARVLIEVPDPHGLNLASDSQTPPLMIGAFVEAQIEAKQLGNVIRLSRDYLRQDETVWVMENGELRIKEVDIVFQDAKYAYIRGGITPDAQIVTTNLSTVVDGAPLRTEATTATSAQ